MTRRRTPPATPPVDTPFDAILHAVDDQEAKVLGEIMAAVEPYDQGSVKGVLYKKPVGGVGAFSWIDDIHPPFNLTALMTEMRDRYGPGDYELRVFAGGKIRKNHTFSIAREKAGSTAPVVANSGGGMSEIMALILSQQAEARRDQQAQQAQQMQMFMAMSESQTKLLTAVLPTLAAGRDQAMSPADLIAIITAGQAGKGGSLKEMVETLATLKGLTENPAPAEPGGGLDPEDLIGSAGRLIGPATKAIGDYLARNRGGAASETDATSASGTAAPGAGGQLALGAPVSRFRLIELVKVDVNYGFQRGHAPDKIADLVYDVIEANNVTEDEINELALTFALSPTGLEDLAREGIDLRPNPQWAAEFFDALRAIHTEEGVDLGGEAGGASNTEGNGAARQAGEGRPADS